MPSYFKSLSHAVLEPENLVIRARTISVTSVSQLLLLGCKWQYRISLAKAEIQIIIWIIMYHSLSVISNLIRTQE